MASPTSVAVLVTEDDDNNTKVEPLSLDWPLLSASPQAQRTYNPIRAIVDPILASVKEHEKSHISLALGDPSVYFPPCKIVVQAIQDNLLRSTGYVSAVGIREARQAIADHSNRDNPPSLTTRVTLDHVIITNGCSGALELLFKALLHPLHDTLLVPAPGFPLYDVICQSLGCQTQKYPLEYDHDKEEWYMDLCKLETLLVHQQQQRKTPFKAILINNPSNPTGAVFSKAHLQDFLKLCQRYQLMVIADEIYGDMTLHDSCVFHSLAHVRNEMIPMPQVPIVTASGLGKQYLIPGWRVGWLVFHDNIYHTLQSVLQGTKHLAQVIMGASHLAQWAIPAALICTGQQRREILTWKQEWRQKLRQQARTIERVLRQSPYLQVYRPQGAMYLMVRIRFGSGTNGVIAKRTDLEWTQSLLQEENVLLLPGSCFGTKEDCYFRIVFGAPCEVLEDAGQRIVSFLERTMETSTVVDESIVNSGVGKY